ncbi:MAG: hypothetical protein ACP5OF_01535 [bacterium]
MGNDNTIISSATKNKVVKFFENFDLSSGAWMGILTALMIVFMLTNYILPLVYLKINYNALKPVFDDAVELYKWILAFFAGTKVIYGTHQMIQNIKINGGKNE